MVVRPRRRLLMKTFLMLWMLGVPAGLVVLLALIGVL